MYGGWGGGGRHGNLSVTETPTAPIAVCISHFPPDGLDNWIVAHHFLEMKSLRGSEKPPVRGLVASMSRAEAVC